MDQDQSQESAPQPEPVIEQEYPLYELIIEKQRSLVTLNEAGEKLFKHGFDRVVSGTFVFEGPGSSRPMADEDRWKIAEAATLLKIRAGAREYPRYQMIVDGKSTWCPFSEAALYYNDCLFQVKFGTIAHDSPDVDPREMTNDDRQKISAAAEAIERL